MAESVALEMGIPKSRGLVAGLFSHTPMDANRFLSISGFEERIKNVVSTVRAREINTARVTITAETRGRVYFKMRW